MKDAPRNSATEEIKPEPQIPSAFLPPIVLTSIFPFSIMILSIAPGTDGRPQEMFAASNAGPAAAEVQRIREGIESVFGTRSAISEFVPISASKSGFSESKSNSAATMAQIVSAPMNAPTTGGKKTFTFAGITDTADEEISLQLRSKPNFEPTSNGTAAIFATETSATKLSIVLFPVMTIFLTQGRTPRSNF